jgi:hypothetical protein
MVVDTCNPSTQKAEAGESQVQGQLELHSEFEARLGYIATSCLKTNKWMKTDRQIEMYLIIWKYV